MLSLLKICLLFFVFYHRLWLSSIWHIWWSDVLKWVSKREREIDRIYVCIYICERRWKRNNLPRAKIATMHIQQILTWGHDPLVVECQSFLFGNTGPWLWRIATALLSRNISGVMQLGVVEFINTPDNDEILYEIITISWDITISKYIISY